MLLRQFARDVTLYNMSDHNPHIGIMRIHEQQTTDVYDMQPSKYPFKTKPQTLLTSMLS
jgi:hypothetical protein